MTDRESSFSEENIIPFPQLASRLLDMGISAIKEKDYSGALSYFKQLNELEPNHSQASFGLAVCYVELGHYKEAEELTEDMLKKDIGDYFDVLKLHISVLIQRQQYAKVIHIIEAVIQEGKLNSQMAISLKQLEEFARKRIEEHPSGDDVLDQDDLANDEPKESDQTFRNNLLDNDTTKQWVAIQSASNFLNPERIASIQEYLVNEDGDSFLKSIAVKLLKDQAPELDSVELHKYGQTFHISLDHEPLFDEEKNQQVKEHLMLVEQNNPSLYDMALQIWEHFFIARFPFEINHLSSSAWAAACYFYTQQINGVDPSMSQTANDFNTTVIQSQEALKWITSVEQGSTHLH